ncbi:hypothetical protein Ddye_017631 [Dipteronia dyeriana]|uniref:Uncharacterized protein n=1 Tax=Dipteronia dyeriana TaxID=168575 RepID=A0AAD9U9U1_9ROSI|nr:hypothetical protein Ddye_017631 [Dipteronia dyeriana]
MKSTSLHSSVSSIIGDISSSSTNSLRRRVLFGGDSSASTVLFTLLSLLAPPCRLILGGVYRMKEHLAGTHSNAAPCAKVTSEWAQLTREEMIDKCVTFNSKKGSSSGSVTQREIRGSMDRFLEKDTVDDVEGNRQGLDKDARENTCMEITIFFYENELLFNVANSPSFTNMLRSVGNYERGLKGPTAHELNTTFLMIEEANTQ